MRNRISIERLRDVVNYDKQTGEFTWKNKPLRAKDRVGTIANGYLIICIDGTRMTAHAAAWAHTYGEWPNGHIDHINGVRNSNEISNLRIADYSVNAQNRHNAYKNSNSGILGAKWHKGQQKFVSAIRLGKTQKHLGTFNSAEEANSAYVEAKCKYHPGYVPSKKTRQVQM